MNVLNYPLTNVQMELLKLFSTNMSDEEVIELKGVIARFYAEKATAEADRIWDEKGLTNQDMDKLLNQAS
jgi:hypothetical protein